MSAYAVECMISDWCRRSGDYSTVWQHYGLDDKLLVYSLRRYNKIKGRDEIRKWCDRIGEILGFKPGEVKLQFHARRVRAEARPSTKTMFFGENTSVATIIHEFTHLICDKDTTTMQRDYFGRATRRDIHNAGFAEYQLMALHNVMEHAEELGLVVKSAEEVLREIPLCVKAAALGR